MVCVYGTNMSSDRGYMGRKFIGGRKGGAETCLLREMAGGGVGQS